MDDYFTNINQQKRFSADEETLDNMVKRQRLQQYNQLPTQGQVSPSQQDSDSILSQSDTFSPFNFQPYTPSSQTNFFPFRGPSMLPPPMHNMMQQSQPQMESLNQQAMNQQQQQSINQQQQQQQQQLNYMYYQQPPFFSTTRTSYPNLGQFNSALGMNQTPSNTIAPITAPVLTMESPIPEEPTPNYQSIYKYTPPPSVATSAPQTAQKKAKRGTDPMKKKEGLEESSVRIIGLLQTRGKMIFKDIHETLNIDYRRAYDILNILLTTTLITKLGKKRENKLPFIYQDGTPLPEPVEIRDIMNDIQREEELNATLKQRVALLEEELNKEDPNFKGLKERDPLLQSDPLYKDLV